MLDTNVFNRLLDRQISADSFRGRRLLVTGIQEDELRKTPDSDRRQKLLDIIVSVGLTVVPASSFAFDIEGAGFDQAYFNDGSGTFNKMLQRLQELDLRDGKRKNPLNQQRDILNQQRDILIAETAIKNSAILVSQDRNLRQVVSEFGGQSVSELP